jgi:hypothetical protein
MMITPIEERLSHNGETTKRYFKWKTSVQEC